MLGRSLYRIGAATRARDSPILDGASADANACRAESCSAQQGGHGSGGRLCAQRIGGQVKDLEDWWRRTAQADLELVIPKLQEYGSLDLELIGLALGSDAEAGVMYYLLGKAGRAVSAYRRGALPSEDTLVDATIYAMMARRIRETGRWP